MRIFYSNVKREIGAVCTPPRIVGTDGYDVPVQPLLVVREATYEEWYEDVKLCGGDPDGWPHQPYYYEVATD